MDSKLWERTPGEQNVSFRYPSNTSRSDCVDVIQPLHSPATLPPAKGAASILVESQLSAYIYEDMPIACWRPQDRLDAQTTADKSRRTESRKWYMFE